MTQEERIDKVIDMLDQFVAFVEADDTDEYTASVAIGGLKDNAVRLQYFIDWRVEQRVKELKRLRQRHGK